MPDRTRGPIGQAQEKDILEIADDAGATVVSFRAASISAATDMDELHKRLQRYVEQTRPQRLIVDFTAVRFFSSTMLGLLVDLWKRLGQYGGRLVISGINPQLTRVFRITNLDRIFAFAPDREAALEQLRTGGTG